MPKILLAIKMDASEMVPQHYSLAFLGSEDTLALAHFRTVAASVSTLSLAAG